MNKKSSNNVDSNIFELNHSNSEYYERHPNCKGGPKQIPLEWHNWDELVDFFENYFQHFGDDVSTLDKETFKRVVKTIWRFSYITGIVYAREEMKENTPSFMEQLKEYFKSIQRHNEYERDEMFPDTITPDDIWHDVLHLKFKKQ
jgi:hemerythrin superfamily protein